MSPFLMGLIGGAGQGLQTLNKQNYDEQVRADEEATRGRLMQQQSDLRIKEEQTVMGLKEAAAQRTRQTMVDSTNTAAQGMAQSRADTANAQVNQDATDAAGIYQNSDLPDDQKKLGIINSQNYGVTGQVTPTVSTRDIVSARVNAGYTDPLELIKMDQQQAANFVQMRLADIKDKREQAQYELGVRNANTRDAQVDVNDKKADAMFARLGAAIGKDKQPAEVQATQWYMDNADDPSAMAAWDKVHESKSKNVVSIAADLMSKDPNKLDPENALTADKAFNIASTLYDKATAKNGATPSAVVAPPPAAYTFVPGKGLVKTGK